MPKRKETTLVVFRRWRDTGELLALFPELPADSYGNYCDSYERVGQHSGADYYGCILRTVPVTARDAAPLASELRRIGYRLKLIKRASRRTHEIRRETARAYREAS